MYVKRGREACTGRMWRTWCYEPILLREGVKYSVGKTGMWCWQLGEDGLAGGSNWTVVRSLGQRPTHHKPIWMEANKQACLPGCEHWKGQQGDSLQTTAGLLHWCVYDQETAWQLTYATTTNTLQYRPIPTCMHPDNKTNKKIMLKRIIVNCERTKTHIDNTDSRQQDNCVATSNKLSAHSGKRIKSTKLTDLAGDPEMVC